MWRARPAPHEFALVGNDNRQITANTVHTFNTRIPVNPGDRLGLTASVPPGQPIPAVAYGDDSGLSELAVLSDNAVGDPQPRQRSEGGFLLDVSARVESDADRDGFGDDTQDGCPSRADRQGSCSGGQGGADKTKPKVTGLRLRFTAFRAAGSGSAFSAGGRTAPVGTRVAFTASEASAVTFTVQRKTSGRKVGKKCKAPTRRTRAGSGARTSRSAVLRRQRRRGRERLHVPRAHGGRKLSPAPTG